MICHVVVVRRWGSFDFTSVLAAYTRAGFAAVLAGAAGAGVLALLGGYTFGFAWDTILTAIVTCAAVGLVMSAVFVLALRAMRVPEFQQLMVPMARRIPILARLGR